MGTMGLQLLIFLSFLAISLAIHLAQHICAKKQARERKEAEEAGSDLKVHHHGYLAVIASCLAHPVTLESLKEFAAHIVVYSGHIIPKH